MALTNYFATWSGLEVATAANTVWWEGLQLSLDGVYSMIYFALGFIQANFALILWLVALITVMWFISVMVIRKFRSSRKSRMSLS